ncbi:2-oxo-4-hydroxy-4-carboxy-5-ureidoimidazoline decarboxylase [Pseudonocardia nigra]|uniref:2-oxo-4-hydroxy-4-carboxy-5-ureidoimidazoline decarboxylase n=1 Tax=Pseudonocardia nigra TaxID=1921578 RepID=UPI001C5E5E49|nr:2-oxo-4-hydroxy-4-carboxy-5-ureidoimidazoline decarboxylase [Pseudonocardia nigra]
MPLTPFEELNRSPTDSATSRLAACNASGRWIADVLAGRPYADPEALLTAAEKAVHALSWPDVREALDAHPRIGARAEGASTEAAWSRREQAAVGDSDAATRAALHAGNVAYEQRFGHVFLIRAAGRSAEEMLAELRRRLDHDETQERAEVVEQLAQITRLRVERLITA